MLAEVARFEKSGKTNLVYLLDTFATFFILRQPQRVNVWRIGRASSIWSLTGNSSVIESLCFDPSEEFLVCCAVRFLRIAIRIYGFKYKQNCCDMHTSETVRDFSDFGLRYDKKCQIVRFGFNEGSSAEILLSVTV